MMNNHHSVVAALAALALIGTTLGIATPAFAAPKVTKVVTTTVMGKGTGADCPVSGSNPLPDGTTVTQVFTYGDGTQGKTTSQCKNGTWVVLRALPGHNPVSPIDNNPPAKAK